MDRWKDPLLWIPTLISFFLFMINLKTFKLLYEKPKFVITSISLLPTEQDGIGGYKTTTHIKLDILNPSTSNGLIIGSKLRLLPFGPVLCREDVTKPLLAFSKTHMYIGLDYNNVTGLDNRFVLLVLLDIKNRKIWKIFRLKNYRLL